MLVCFVVVSAAPCIRVSVLGRMSRRRYPPNGILIRRKALRFSALQVLHIPDNSVTQYYVDKLR